MPRIATACLAAFIAFAAAAPAFAQAQAQTQDRAPRAPRAGDHHVRIDDLDLSSANGAARFDERVDRQARSACSGVPTLSGLQCRQSLSRELRDALPAQQRQDYARGRSGRVLAMVTTFSA